MDNHSIRTHKQGKRTVITLTGLLDRDMAVNLTNITAKAEPPILLNLEQVNFISAQGSRAILEIYLQHDQKPLIKAANKHILSMLELSGASRYVEVLPGQNNPHKRGNHGY